MLLKPLFVIFLKAQNIDFTIKLFSAHVDNEMCLVKALERLGTVALTKEEPDIGAAFLKFSVVTKELSALMKTLVRTFYLIMIRFFFIFNDLKYFRCKT